jgi:hypothetical protein
MTSLSHPNRIGVRRTTALAAVLLLGTVAAACSDDDSADAAYCDSLQEARTAFEQYSEVDIVQGGLDSVRQYIDGIEAALADVRAANDARIGEEADAFRAALDELVNTVTTGSLPVDRREQVRAASAEVDRTWAELEAAAEIECPATTS